MWLRLGADALLLLHFLWIVFLVSALPLGIYFRLRTLRILHATGLVLALILQFTRTICPLTILEEYLRNFQQPDFDYKGSFIITHVEKLVYPGWISLNTIIILTVLLAGMTLLSFILWPLRHTSKQNKSTPME